MEPFVLDGTEIISYSFRYGKAIDSVRLSLKTVRGSKQLKLDPSIYDSILKQRIEVESRSFLKMKYVSCSSLGHYQPTQRNVSTYYLSTVYLTFISLFVIQNEPHGIELALLFPSVTSILSIAQSSFFITASLILCVHHILSIPDQDSYNHAFDFLLILMPSPFAVRRHHLHQVPFF